VTCRAKLRVRDERVLGQIHACPKCGSMVEIAPPAGWATTPELAGAAALATVAASGSSVTFPSPGSIAAVTAPVGKSPGVLTSWLHSTAFLWSAGGAAMLAVVGIGASLVWHNHSESPPQLAATYAAPPAATSDEAQPTAENPQSAAAISNVNERVDLPAAEVVEKLVEASRPVDLATVSENVAAPASVSDQPAAASDDTQAIQASADLMSAAESPRTLKLEPIPGDAEPARVMPSSVVESSAANSPRYLTTKDSVGATALSEISAPAEEAPLAQAPRALLRFGPSSQDAAHRTNIADQVAVPIKSFDMSDAPLSRVLETLANLAAVPITVDPAVFAAAGVSPDAKVTVHARDTTLGKILGGVLRERKLACEVRDGQLTVLNSDNRQTAIP
jgi:hypothetical protein